MHNKETALTVEDEIVRQMNRIEAVARQLSLERNATAPECKGSAQKVSSGGRPDRAESRAIDAESCIAEKMPTCTPNCVGRMKAADTQTKSVAATLPTEQNASSTCKNASDSPQSRMPSNIFCNRRMSTELAKRDGDMGLPLLREAAEHGSVVATERAQAPIQEEGISATLTVAERAAARQASSEVQRGSRDGPKNVSIFCNCRMEAELEKRKGQSQFCPHGPPVQARQGSDDTPRTIKERAMRHGWSRIAAASETTTTLDGSSESPNAAEVAEAEKRAELIQERLSRAAAAKEQLLAAISEATAAGVQVEQIVGHVVGHAKNRSKHLRSQCVDGNEEEDFDHR
eukprot:CAMPEP_0119320542 /NCGR_PEP_ID=MMETSP1333-20130426/52745_1 /TAXON_ID=418940 /ORGANISM="Scyphosphaera apsteinii, Strain RCC1455" /LENGTH=343 /DNA_ID=CAMNT_0007327289 /DNA_START=297 /DNA_END=1324 /DNA_ORIENTATION=-